MTGFTNIQDPEIQKRLFTEKRQRINALYTERNIWLTSQEYKEKFVACEPTNFPNVMEKQWFMLYYSLPKKYENNQWTCGFLFQPAGPTDLGSQHINVPAFFRENGYPR